jgi:hypothetical protein
LGIAHLAMRFAESIGIPNDETTINNEYADGLGKGQRLVAVLASTDERDKLAGRLIEEHGGSSVRFIAQYTIQSLRSRAD